MFFSSQQQPFEKKTMFYIEKNGSELLILLPSIRVETARIFILHNPSRTCRNDFDVASSMHSKFLINIENTENAHGEIL